MSELPTSTKLKTFFKEYLVQPIINQLKQGYTVNQISISASIGLGVSIIPLLGTSTLLGFLAAYAFRLNHIVIQTVNYFAAPLQFILIIPYLHYGQVLFSSETQSLNLANMFSEFADAPLVFFKTYGMVALYGFLLWLITMVIFIPAAYFIIRSQIYLFYRVGRRK